MNILGQFKGLPFKYQQEDYVNIARHGGSMLIGYETGLGKTFESLYTLSGLNKCEVVLITGGKSAIATWRREVPRWTQAETKYIGISVAGYKDIWQDFLRGVPGVYLINHTLFKILFGTYKKSFGLKKIKKPKCDAVIVDEAHKLRNRKTQLFQCVSNLDYTVIQLDTATPSSRGPQDLWSYLHLIDRRRFSSYWKFVATFCYVEEGAYGREVFGARNLEALRNLLKDYYIRRTYAEVAADLPPLRRQAFEVEMSPDQAKLYTTLSEEMVLELPNGDTLLTPGVLALMTRLRQLALCPQLLDDKFPIGACIENVLEEVLGDGDAEDPDTDHHVVIFSVYRSLLEVLSRILTTRGVPWEMLHGGLEPDEVNTRVSRFKQGRKVMLCVATFAESFALDTVKVAYVIGADFDPTVNIQAEGRLRRIDSKLDENGILVRYVYPIGTREVVTRDIINEKAINVSQYIKGFAGGQ